MPNTLVSSLVAVLRARALDEKILLAPTARTGGQWLDAAARTGTPTINIRVKTFRGYAVETAGLAEAGKEYVGGVLREALVAGILESMGGQEGYFSRLVGSPALARSLAATLSDMRLAGLSSGMLLPTKFETKEKAEAMRHALALYEKALEEGNRFDYADTLRAAAPHIRQNPPQAFFLMSRDMEENLQGLERDLWEALPKERRIVLDTDEAVSPDTHVEAFRAVGEVNEVREVFRRCVSENIPFDDVEVLYTDGETYVPLLYEEARRLTSRGAEDVSVTFIEGVPARYGRPARALALWMDGVRGDFAQPSLVKMLEEGLLKAGSREEAQALATEFAALPVGAGRKRTLEVIEAEISRCVKPRRARNGDEEGESAAQAAARRRRGERLERLCAILSAVVKDAPAEQAPAKEIFDSAIAFLDRHAYIADAFDGYVLKKLKEDIEGLATAWNGAALSPEGAWEWIADALRAPHIAGERPMPGKMHAAPWRAGGHSGRRWTFILGLDEGRFPGAGLQDPFLLDGERARLSSDLPTSGGRLEKTERDFHRLLARLRGNVVLSCSVMDLTDEREIFSARAFPALEKENPVAFAPADEERCLDEGDWWLFMGRGGAGVKDAEKILGERYPRLGRGFVARDARKSTTFTAFDGFVPEAGRRMNPFAQDAPVFSAHRLETLAKCPMEYFLKYVLEIEPREVFKQDPARWLDTKDKGSLLHEVFRAFMAGLVREGKLPDFARDEKVLLEILEAEFRAWKSRVPPPNDEAFLRDAEEMRQAARIFLREEEAHCRTGNVPRFFEAAIGLPQEEGEVTPLDSPDPVFFSLGNGKAIKIRGRIDRVDEVIAVAERQFAVWDYKTGSATFHREWRKKISKGLILQGVFYKAFAEARLPAVGYAGAEVVSFGYFFPSPRALGERVTVDAATLVGGRAVVEKLCALLAAGCFPFTPTPKDDLKFSDYVDDVFFESEAMSKHIENKIQNAQNTMLARFRDLRGLEEKDGEE